MRFLYTAVAVTALALVTSFAAFTVSAQTTPKKSGLEVNPAYFDITVDKTQTERKIVLNYTNYTNQPISISVSAYNYSQKEVGETPVFDKNDSNKGSSLLPYITLDPQTTIIAPNQKQKVTITINNNEELSPGGHYAAIIAEVNQEIATNNKPIVAPSVSSLILLKKEGGEKYGLGFDGYTDNISPVVFNYPSILHPLFTNSGNIHLVIYGTAEVKDMFGRVLHKGVVNSSSLILFPKKSRTLSTPMHVLKGSFPISLNTITLSGQDSLHKVSYSYQKKYVYVNILSTLVVLFIGFTIVLFIRTLLRKKR